jgi:hypothetical protein
MNEHARQLLLKLLNSWQANPESSRAVTLPLNSKRASSFYAISDFEERESILYALKDAEKKDSIRIVYGKREESHLIEKIILADGHKLAVLLGEILAVDKVSDMQASLDKIVSGKYFWICEAHQECLAKWRLGKSAFEIAADNLSLATNLFKALEAVADGLHVDVDMRSFSARYLGDSKAFERLSAKFASVWRRQTEFADLDTGELLQSLGILKYPWPLMVKGDIVFHFRNTVLNTAGIGPYLGVPISEIDTIAFELIPSYVLFIENFASFNRYVHEINDNSLIVYTNGFPSPHLSRLISMIGSNLPQTVSFYHWGDIDVGGLKIFRKLEEVLVTHVLLPHQMSVKILLKHGKETENQSSHSLKKLATSHSQVSALARSIMEMPVQMMLEQEILDPVSPFDTLFNADVPTIDGSGDLNESFWGCTNMTRSTDGNSVQSGQRRKTCA